MPETTRTNDQAALAAGTDLCARATKMVAVAPPDQVTAFHNSIGLMYEFASVARQMEIAGIAAEVIRKELQPARNVMSASSLVRRLQTWPRGYPGDFETIEQIATGGNRCEAGTWAYFLEQAVLHSGAVRQHQNKLRYQCDAIRRAIARVGPSCRLLTVGCGGARDFLEALPVFSGFEGLVMLNDIDRDALTLAEKRLALVTHRFNSLHCNALKAIRRLESGKPFDLILAGGLFDYLSDRAIISLLSTFFKTVLNERGEVIFTNMACGNPYRTWMEYGADWNLIERSEQQVLGMCEQAGIPLAHVSVQRDETQLTLLVTIVRG